AGSRRSPNERRCRYADSTKRVSGGMAMSRWACSMSCSIVVPERGQPTTMIGRSLTRGKLPPRRSRFQQAVPLCEHLRQLCSGDLGRRSVLRGGRCDVGGLPLLTDGGLLLEPAAPRVPDVAGHD